MVKVLVVDNEDMIRDIIREYAEFEGHEVKEAENGIDAVDLCMKEDFDVIVMDIMMPGIDGFTAYEKIKRIKNIPAIILSARGEEYDKLYGFQLGIEDYVVKPFSPKELMARLSVIVKRNRGNTNQIAENKKFTFGGLIIDGESYCVYTDGKKVEMTLREFDLLYFLATHPNVTFSRNRLLDNIWGYDYVGDGRTVDTHIKMLRHALGDYRKFIVTTRGVGYRFEVV